jgi:hypothetical protein
MLVLDTLLCRRFIDFVNIIQDANHETSRDCQDGCFDCRVSERQVGLPGHLMDHDLNLCGSECAPGYPVEDARHDLRLDSVDLI